MMCATQAAYPFARRGVRVAGCEIRACSNTPVPQGTPVAAIGVAVGFMP
jgi:folate-dependent tRNA-U54 methylase TrmFO/GidA